MRAVAVGFVSMNRARISAGYMLYRNIAGWLRFYNFDFGLGSVMLPVQPNGRRCVGAVKFLSRITAGGLFGNVLYRYTCMLH